MEGQHLLALAALDGRTRFSRSAGRAMAVALVSLLTAAAGFVSSLAGPRAALPPPPVLIATTDTADSEHQFLALLNQARADNGLPPLVANPGVATTSRTWSESMRRVGSLSHDPNLRVIVEQIVPSWTRLGENVGVGYDVAGLHQAFWQSSGHRQNMLGDFNQVGIGVVRGGDSRIWVTVRFIKGDLPAATAVATTRSRPDRVGIRRANTDFLRNSLSSGPADLTFAYGASSDIAVMGDWNGDGAATPGVFRNGQWYLRNSNTSGNADSSFSYGRAGDVPIVGDWDGNGTDTVGVWRNGSFLLRNANDSGEAAVAVSYGTVSDRPIVGDWDGNRTDTVGVHRGNTFYLRNANSAGGADISVAYGWSSDTPLVGDWDGNRTDTVGVRRGNSYYLRNANSGGGADVTFAYGWASDQVVVGSW